MLTLIFSAVAAEFLPEERIFALPMADTRSPQSSVLIKWPFSGGSGVDAAIATDFPLLFAQLPKGVELEVGLAAGGFMNFWSEGELTFDLYTFDGLFGLPVDVRWGPLSARLQWAHLSAHYGDALRKLKLRPDNVDSWSREYWQLQVAGDWRFLHPYAGLRLIAHEVRDDDPPLAVQLGVDLLSPWKIGPCGGANLWLAGEDAWVPAVDVVGGACFSGRRHRLRLSAAFRDAPEDTGKLQGNHEQYVGLSFGFDTAGPVGME